MKRDNKNMIKAVLGIAALVMVGCTEKRPYDKEDRDPTAQVQPVEKSKIIGVGQTVSEEYLYLPSTVNSTRTTDATFPMYMGDAKIVRLLFGEDALRVVQVDEDGRFNSNPVNSKPVLSVPIEHLDYHCAKDAEGKCSNKEEVDAAKPWAQRKYFKIQAEKLAKQEIQFMPIEIGNLFFHCYDEVGSQFLSSKVEADAINIAVEKTYKTSIRCAGKLNDISDLTFRVVDHYSFVKLDKISSKDYKSLKHVKADETSFGFFDTHTLKLGQDNNDNEDGEKVFLNRWNPAKSPVYYLSENFNAPENARIKAVTIKAVKNLNVALKRNGVDLQIDLREPVAGMEVGDIRNSMIVAVEDPINYGLLGYGPTAANPRTGEIVNGRVAMYLGVMKTTVKRAWEELVLEKLQQAAQAQAKTAAKSGGKGDANAKVDAKNMISLAPELVKFSKPRSTVDIARYAQIEKAIATGQELESAPTRVMASQKMAAKNSGDIKPKVSKAKLLAHTSRRVERKVTLQELMQINEVPEIKKYVKSLHCFYDLEDFNANDAIEDELDKLVADIGVKSWLDLSEEEQTRVLDTLLPFVWGPTLIHEIGHALGLRHNFAGSEDKDNFYSKKELEDMGIRREFAYSSMMDYGYHSTKELQILGKYDIAALRFAYAETVQLENGDLVPLEKYRKTANATLRAFKFCTDEHVDVNPNCNRFDEGTSLSEIADHWQMMYEESYLRRSFRNGLRNFSLYDDDIQVGRVNNIMENLRSMFERYEDIKNTFGLADDGPEWEEYDFLKDLKEATHKAAAFYVSVLNTPDTMCAVATAKKPNQIIALLPLKQLTPFAISCFDGENVQLNPAYVIVGEAGKAFQSRKDPNSGNPYVDQIDVRGIWIDKLLAAHALTDRLTGVSLFDEYKGNFLDIADLREPIQYALSAILLDEVVAPVPIFTVTGQVLVAEVGIRMFESADAVNGHIIPEPLDGYIQRIFGIPNGGTNFQLALVDILQGSLGSREQVADETSLLNSIAANAGLPIGSSPDDFLTADIGLTRYFVNLKSEVAALTVASRGVVEVLARLGDKEVARILADLIAKKPAGQNATKDEKIARALGTGILERFLDGGFQDRAFYDQMIQAMAAN